jgi:hypothetical protein
MFNSKCIIIMTILSSLTRTIAIILKNLRRMKHNCFVRTIYMATISLIDFFFQSILRNALKFDEHCSIAPIISLSEQINEILFSMTFLVVILVSKRYIMLVHSLI